MSWQAAVICGLALVVIGGFWWFERARPTARMVALVAALAALAIAGRLVLAPFPNVVATTDIALIAGYALGAGPGFAVGALAAPISNIWLGQGPWTAWEMAGWGLVGLGGAWLAVLSARRLGRLGLAIACALAGLAYGALLDLSVMVTYGGEQSLDRYLALSARGLPFNVAHAAGNFAIALAAGPALVRMISRFRIRQRFSWHPAGALPVVLVILLAGTASLALPEPSEARRSAVSWLAAAQNPDGGFAASPGQPSSPAMTGWAMLGLEAGGRNPLDVRTGGRSPVAYLRGEIGRLRSVGDLERTILALQGAGIDPRRFAGRDLVADLRRRRDRDGSVDGQVNLTAFYALAMRAAGARPSGLRRTAGWLARAQNPDGGWGIQPGAPSEADSTGAALQGLAAAGGGGRAASSGAGWLARAQRGDGGYALSSTGLVNSQSTAWAVQGLVAAAGAAAAIDRAVGYLGRRRAPDGHYRYSAASDQTPVWVTAQALVAVERRPFPLAAVARATRQRSERSASDEGGSGATAPADAVTAPAGPATGTGSTAPGVATDSAGGSGTRTPAGGPATGGGAGTDGAGEPGARAAGAATEAPPADPAAATESQAASATPVSVGYAEPADEDRTTTLLLAGLGVLALVGAVGYVAYRRRSPH